MLAEPTRIAAADDATGAMPSAATLATFTRFEPVGVLGATSAVNRTCTVAEMARYRWQSSASIRKRRGLRR